MQAKLNLNFKDFLKIEKFKNKNMILGHTLE